MRTRINKAQQRELDRLTKKKRSRVLAAKDVVSFARDPEAALHKVFEWDDTAAAEQYRLQQAAMVIRAYVVVMPTDDKPVKVRAYTSLPSTRGEQKYRRTKDVLKKSDWRREMVEMAKSELFAIEKKYRILSELASVWDAIDGL